MRNLIIAAVLLLITPCVYSQSFDYSKIGREHPRLLLKKGDEQKLLKTFSLYSELQKINKQVLDSCDKILNMPVQYYHKEGKRLYAGYISSSYLFYLSYAYRITHNKQFLFRAEKEINALCSFPSWNPSHFLDVGSITMSLAIAYDWMYNDLTSELKSLIRKSIIEKGFEPSKIAPGNWFYTLDTNWNSVCNASLVFAALAIYEDEPKASEEIIEKCMETIYKPLKSYEPDGAYPEGYSYWQYGTSHQVFLDAALESVFGTDNGLSKSKGFMESAYYMLNMVGPTGYCFNYSDCGGGLIDHVLLLFWFAKKMKDSSILWWEQALLNKRLSTEEDCYLVTMDRYLPLALSLFSNCDFQKISKPKQTMWVGKGITPVVLVRNSWDNNATFFGVKGGLAVHSHAHMDAGSFVFDALGLRWAMDLGSQDYESLEKYKIDLFNPKTQRWDILRFNSRHHNTLTINGNLHDINAHATIVKVSDSKEKRGAIIDLSSVLNLDVQKAYRSVNLINNKYLEITDDLTSKNHLDSVQWIMCTPASAQIIAKNIIQLSQKGKKLNLVVDSPKKIDLKIWSNAPEHYYDAPNPGTLRVGFIALLRPNEHKIIKVRLIPLN